MIEHESAILGRIAYGRAEFAASTRFMRNEAVEAREIVEAIAQQCRSAVDGRDVLALQDTTDCDFSNHSGRLRWRDPDLGPLPKTTAPGFFLHPCLVLSADSGFPLGLADIQVWNRSWDGANKHARRYYEQPTAQKESQRWLTCSERAVDVLTSARHVTFIADREGDFYEWFARTPDAQTDLLVRARIDRLLAKPSPSKRPPGSETSDSEAPDSDASASVRKLYALLAQQEVAGRLQFDVSEQRHRQARRVTAEVRFTKATLKRPHKADVTLAPSLTLWAVEVLETAASVPTGEKPVRWCLLSTRPIRTLAEARWAIEAYRWRWQIEQLFRTIKRQGLEIEASQLTSGAALKKLALMSLEVATVVMQLVQARDGAAKEAARLVFSEQEELFLSVLCRGISGKTRKQQNPHGPGSLSWASWIVARLGGWDCYGGPPGPIRMLRGLRRFADQYAGWLLSQPEASPRSQDQTKDVCGE